MSAGSAEPYLPVTLGLTRQAAVALARTAQPAGLTFDAQYLDCIRQAQASADPDFKISPEAAIQACADQARARLEVGGANIICPAGSVLSADGTGCDIIGVEKEKDTFRLYAIGGGVMLAGAIVAGAIYLSTRKRRR